MLAYCCESFHNSGMGQKYLSGAQLAAIFVEAAIEKGSQVPGGDADVILRADRSETGQLKPHSRADLQIMTTPDSIRTFRFTSLETQYSLAKYFGRQGLGEVEISYVHLFVDCRNAPCINEEVTNKDVLAVPASAGAIVEYREREERKT